ncbi:tryptophan synthase subunit alpha [Tuberibacillus sp. Marseille-P3662]|uniref:tryptophan synthase subunit alpha n=1 Tax=Tuberibacillus sp. Marseille-P3662 TaxID=1965358 RepID=UPI000A1CB624|nr:tryptophan synthase subunit alpha [Tuberibacillus sp. Marseille-P3662]
MTRLDTHLSDHPLFIPFITAGDPSPEVTIDLALMLQDLGANAIELGIPFSDPLADGPVIQRASARALSHGVTLETSMNLAKQMRKHGVTIPIIIFTYYNPLVQLGEQQFINLANDCDIDGVLVPDLPFEESHELKRSLNENKLALIHLVAPTTSEERLQNICQNADGFLYCVSSLGVTGERGQFAPSVYTFLQRVKNYSDIPIAVGFGVSSRKQMMDVKDDADGVVVGSAIVREIENNQHGLLEPTSRQQVVAAIRERLWNKFFDKQGVGE